ncbi:MAG: prolyl hydroxylase family protein, partial [Novosphingobium sp.]
MTATFDPTQNGPNPDRAALVRVGELVRQRLGSDPSVYRIPTEKADIFAIRDFLSGDECDQMMALIDKVAKPSALYSNAYGSEFRTSYSGDVDRNDPFVRMVERRLDDLLGLDPTWGETVQGQRYLQGQQFKAHFDWFWTLADYWKGEKDRGGQRSWTAMVYLNDVEDGGDTDFSALCLSIPPQRGVLLIWNNASPDGEVNRDTIHAGTPVVKGAKYVITK